MTKKNNKVSNIRVMWAMLCRSASVDQASNLISLQNIVEEVTLGKTPPNGIKPSGKIEDFPKKTKIASDFAFVIQFQRDNTEDEKEFDPMIRITISDPSGEVLADKEFPIKFENGKKRMRVIINFDGMVVKQSGSYSYKVFTRSLKDEKFEEKSSTELEIRIFA